MRVIGGSARGRKLATPKDSRIRPTADRVKEALFSILTSYLGNLSGIRVLDIFAGTGNLGIEALSRGAESAVFIDNHRDSVELINKNLSITAFADRSQVFAREAISAIGQLEKSGATFNLVFLDPPYHKGLIQEVLNCLSHSSIISDDTVIVAEFADKEEIPEQFGELKEFDRRMYGDTALSFLTSRTEE